MNVALNTKRYFTCPNGCQHEFVVEHLLAELECGTYGQEQTTAGPWYCDNCGQGWLLTLFKTGAVQVEKHEQDSKKSCWVILEIPPQSEPIRLKVRGIYFGPSLTQEELDHKRYFYEEHTCPTNYFCDVEEISIGTDNDPHGLATVVAVYDVDVKGEDE